MVRDDQNAAGSQVPVELILGLIVVYIFIKGLSNGIGGPQRVNECTNGLGTGEFEGAIQRVAQEHWRGEAA